MSFVNCAYLFFYFIFAVFEVHVGDETMSVLEIWGAEYQENNALLIKPESTETFLAMAKRENCPASLLGKVSGDGRVTVKDSRDGSVPYDLPLKVGVSSSLRRFV